jgi:hypothetical protein
MMGVDMTRPLLLLAVSAACLAAQPDNPLAGLRKSHPRLLALDSDVQRVRGFIQTEPAARELYGRLKAEAARIEGQSPVEYKIVGPRLLAQSRLCLSRVYTLGLLWRLDGERRWLDRALLELRTAANFPDWNPKHFLDTAEMAHALAIGYDWFYHALDEKDRALIRGAIIEKGLDPAMPFYKEDRSWARAAHNWNQVCNGGIAIGALAVAEHAPDQAAYIVRRSVETIPRAMASYAPEGGWAEGPGYWHYATRYNVYYLAALESALGTDFGLSRLTGFPQAGDFRVYFSGPAGTFNYADATARIGNAAEMFWLARKFNQPVYAHDELRHLDAGMGDAFDLLWFHPRAASPKAAGWPLARLFKGVEVAFLRSAWEDPNAFWLAIKGGDNKANHSHLDLGTFVLDAKGQRWAVDLGADDYNLPGFFGAQRWTYYRLRTESHNTVLIDGENQDTAAKAPFVRPYAIDLAAAYPGKLKRFTREASLDAKGARLRDDIEAVQPVEALWGMMTDAEVALEGRFARLTKGGASLTAEILAPRDARFEVVSASPPPPQNPNTGFRKLVVRLPGKIVKTRIEVAFR